MHNDKESLTGPLLAGNAGAEEEWESTTSDITNQNDAVEPIKRPRGRGVSWSRSRSRKPWRSRLIVEGDVVVLALLLLLNLIVVFLLGMRRHQPMTDAECGAQVSLWCEFCFVSSCLVAWFLFSLLSDPRDKRRRSIMLIFVC